MPLKKDTRLLQSTYYGRDMIVPANSNELFCPVCLDLLACRVTMGGGVRKDSDEPAVREKTS